MPTPEPLGDLAQETAPRPAGISMELWFWLEASRFTERRLGAEPQQYGSLLHAFLEETLLLLNKDNNNGLASASESASDQPFLK